MNKSRHFSRHFVEIIFLLFKFKSSSILYKSSLRKKELKRACRKANFDVEITLDILKMIEKFDTLVLFSGDSDFDYLIRRLRAKEKKVVVISTKYHISKELIKNSNKYIDIKQMRPLIE